MRLRTLAEIATIVALVVALLSYFKVEPNVLDKIPEIHKAQATHDVEAVDLKLNKKDYSGRNSPLYQQYEAAIAMDGAYNKDNALSSVIDNALASKDFRIAVLAGKAISNSYNKTQELMKVVESALGDKKHAGYAIVAAEIIPSSYSKDQALGEIVKYYDGVKKEEGIGSSSHSSLDFYKDVYLFADSSPYMNMDEGSAKKFADMWVKNRTYKEFDYFKKVFIFADSLPYMDMNSSDAKNFALDWISRYSEDEFSVFKSAFLFANGLSGMNLSSDKARAFALEKVEEYRKEKAAKGLHANKKKVSSEK